MPAIERASLQLNYSSDLHLIPRGAQHETGLNQTPRAGYPIDPKRRSRRNLFSWALIRTLQAQP